MYLPPIEPNCNYEPFVSGDVTIAPDAAIAPGVIIQAGPDGRIVIASGVCIGMGAIIHAYNGTIEIEEGATIGAGVLVVGQAKIAAKACIGSLSTLINYDLEPQQTIAAASILGDTSRQILAAAAPTSTSTNGKEAEPISSGVATTPTQAKEAEPISSGVATTPTQAKEAEPISSGVATTPTKIEKGPEEVEHQSKYVYPEPRQNTFIQPKPISIPETLSLTNNGAIAPAAEVEASESQEEHKPQTPKSPVAGLDYVQSMMKTLFPHKNISLSSEDEED